MKHWKKGCTPNITRHNRIKIVCRSWIPFNFHLSVIQSLNDCLLVFPDRIPVLFSARSGLCSLRGKLFNIYCCPQRSIGAPKLYLLNSCLIQLWIQNYWFPNRVFYVVHHILWVLNSCNIPGNQSDIFLVCRWGAEAHEDLTHPLIFSGIVRIKGWAFFRVPTFFFLFKFADHFCILANLFQEKFAILSTSEKFAVSLYATIVFSGSLTWISYDSSCPGFF